MGVASEGKEERTQGKEDIPVRHSGHFSPENVTWKRQQGGDEGYEKH